MSVTDDDLRPKKVQIADALRSEIAAMPEGGKLASLRTLADRFDVTPVTVGNALQILMDEGLIKSVPTRGYFVQESTIRNGDDAPTDEVSREEINAIHSEIRQLAARVAELEKRADHTSSA
ncbi:winged helix-turn-helix domain-containing protein [Streptomyces beihaiensis]|uniref:Winged helix-turn-helix domain-containing protein n=1 Tax=Streptomyces beihaiensis TaxID=2984495 RepID=A0ABT3TV96_9ACTN|nr:winged helix-turn-helix domain-containing protein [Streptomyces beihaiensis]MCX3060406.1 winged helix-turn-helix domain-containing protein [Streptomyces beihaiensis]